MNVDVKPTPITGWLSVAMFTIEAQLASCTARRCHLMKREETRGKENVFYEKTIARRKVKYSL